MHWSSRDAGVGVQLVCHAAHALCHQRKLHLVPKARSMHLHALPHPPCSQVWRILSRSPCQNRRHFLLALGDIFPTRLGWRGVMAPYINTLLDRRFGISRSWKWTPLLQSLITGVIWAVGEICRSLYQHRIPTHTTLSFLFVLQVWHVPVFYVDAASQSKCNFWQFLMQEPMQVPPPAARPFPAPSLRT